MSTALDRDGMLAAAGRSAKRGNGSDKSGAGQKNRLIVGGARSLTESGESEDKGRNGVAPPAGAAAKPAAIVPADAVLGQVVWLMLQMPAFRHVFLADLEWMVLPPILLNQFRLLRDGNRIVAFAAWASLSDEAEARLQQPNPRLAPTEWKSGDRLWLVHLFAPFGHTKTALEELRTTALAGKKFSLHQTNIDGTRIVQTIG